MKNCIGDCRGFYSIPRMLVLNRTHSIARSGCVFCQVFFRDFVGHIYGSSGSRRACDKTAQGCRASGYPGFQMRNNAPNPKGVSEGISGWQYATQPFRNPVGVSMNVSVYVPGVAASAATPGYPVKALRANADLNRTWH
jgi:hypothetical protein